MHARKNKEGGNQMKDNELLFDRKSHVLYSKPCKKEILAKIVLHYPEAEREMIWEQVQRQYAVFLSDWRTDLGGKKNFHNGVGGTYDCIAIMSYYVVCKAVTSFREIEEMEENLILPTFRKLNFVDCNKPFWRKLMYKAFVRAKSGCDKWHDYEMSVAPYETDKPIYYELRRARQRSLPLGTALRILCPPCAMWTLRLWSCSMQGLYGRAPAWTAADATIPSAAIKIRT